MEKEINFTVHESEEIKERVLYFFNHFNFNVADNKNNQIKFYKHSSLLETWKSNPLNWGSEVLISMNQNTVYGVFKIDSHAQLKTKEEEYVWDTFLNSLKVYVNDNNKINDSKIVSAIKKNKKSKIKYWSWTFFGITSGLILYKVFRQFYDSNLFILIMIIPFTTKIFLKYIIKNTKLENAL